MNEVLKTGTTTIGLVCKDCVVLAADKRATAGTLIADKKTLKVHKVADNMALTTAGSVSDLQLLTKLIKAELKLKEIRTMRRNTVREAANLLGTLVYSNVRQFFPGVTHFLLGGFDDKPRLFDIFPDGSVVEVDDFVASGSGSVFAYGLLEGSYKQGLSETEGVKLAVKAINSALQRDSASGEGVDVFVIDKEGVRQVLKKKLDLKLE